MIPIKLLLLLLCLSALLSSQEMSIEEKVGQLLMVCFQGSEANENAKILIQQAHVGGIIYYRWSNGLENPSQIKTLSDGLQYFASNSSTQIPLLIAIDQEGGDIVRLKNGFTQFVGNREIALTNDPRKAKAIAYVMGKEMRAVGINMNLAPVVDVSPAHCYMAQRSFSDSPEKVTKFGKMALEGYKKAKTIATLKHFPGYGDAIVDPHLGLPIVNKTRDELEKKELYPFQKLAKEADCIMSAHILMPALDEENCATLSHAILDTLLREEWKYKGVVISDSLVMQGLLNVCENLGEASVQAILAGNDILIFGGKKLGQKDPEELTVKDILNIHAAIVMAVRNQRISEERLQASVDRILKLKQKYGILKTKEKL